MSNDEVTTNIALVKKPIATQCPHLPIHKVDSGGTDNDIYKLGDDMCVRLPLKTPKWLKPPIGMHGNVKHNHLLARNGKLAAVINFGLMGIGDPVAGL